MEVADRESLQASWASPKRGTNSPSSSLDDEGIMLCFEGLSGNRMLDKRIKDFEKKRYFVIQYSCKNDRKNFVR
jgi:hypothetical protein